MTHHSTYPLSTITRVQRFTTFGSEGHVSLLGLTVRLACSLRLACPQTMVRHSPASGSVRDMRSGWSDQAFAKDLADARRSCSMVWMKTRLSISLVNTWCIIDLPVCNAQSADTSSGSWRPLISRLSSEHRSHSMSVLLICAGSLTFSYQCIYEGPRSLEAMMCKI